MSYRQSIYNGVRKFLSDSVEGVAWQEPVKYGAGALAAYGAAKGVVSDDSTVVGGAVGGATFGAVAGGAVSFAAHRSSGFRDLIRDNVNGALGVNKLAASVKSRAADRTEAVVRSGEVEMTPEAIARNFKSHVESKEPINRRFGDVTFEQDDLNRAMARQSDFFGQTDAMRGMVDDSVVRDLFRS